MAETTETAVPETPAPETPTPETSGRESVFERLRRAWERARERRAVRWSIDLALFAVIFSVIAAIQSADLLSSGQPAPDVQLTSLTGERASLADYRGKRTLVVFWAPWCGVCGAESDNVDRVRDWLGDRVQVVSVALDYQSRQDVEQFVAEHDVDYPVLLGDTRAREAFRIDVYPTLYVLDDEGRVDHTVVGYTTTLGMLWRTLL